MRTAGILFLLYLIGGPVVGGWAFHNACFHTPPAYRSNCAISFGLVWPFALPSRLSADFFEPEDR